MVGIKTPKFHHARRGGKRGVPGRLFVLISPAKDRGRGDAKRGYQENRQTPFLWQKRGLRVRAEEEIGPGVLQREKKGGDKVLFLPKRQVLLSETAGMAKG